MKETRLGIIEKLISERPVATQEELQSLLLERGFKVTQATVSRDIKELGLSKVVAENGGYRYAMSSAKPQATRQTQFTNIFKNAVVGVTVCGNLVIIKCHTGTGNAACAALDTMDIPEIAGTIAGDDTIFCAVQEKDGEIVKAKLEQLL